MDKLNENETKDVLDEIYELREEKIDINNEALKEKMHKIDFQEIKDFIQQNFNGEKADENNTKKELINKMELLIENYEIKMANCLESGYKQGFKDAVNLMQECVKK